MKYMPKVTQRGGSRARRLVQGLYSEPGNDWDVLGTQSSVGGGVAILFFFAGH